MQGTYPISTLYRLSLLAGLWLYASAHSVAAQETPEIAGAWIVNPELSDNTDRQVEKALRASGQRVRRRLFDNSTERYRGGPEEQELYDRISYDTELTIVLEEPIYTFTYNDGFTRKVYTDNRSRSVSLSGLDEVEDFSFGYWEEGKLQVEGRPRDTGFTQESYSLVSEGAQLRVELYINPRTFQVPIEIVRIYDRKTPEARADKG